VTLLGGRSTTAGRVFAWGGALLFAAALGYFLYAYAFTFGETQHRRAPVASSHRGAGEIAWDVALFTVFALHHSVFARERVRAFVARTVPASLERSAYVWIASALLIVVCAYWRPIAGVAWQIPAVAGYAIMVAGSWLTLRSAAAIDIWELAGVRQAWLTPDSQPRSVPNAQKETSQTGDFRTAGSGVDEAGGNWEFKTTGPYGYVRHPIYSGWFLLVFGVPTMTATRLVFALVSCAYLLVGITFEERSLRRASNGKYDEYMQRVPSKLVPRIY
jgi:protein-S-isoprenylcysteine O-methyltransferase Ste14